VENPDGRAEIQNLLNYAEFFSKNIRDLIQMDTDQEGEITDRDVSIFL